MKRVPLAYPGTIVREQPLNVLCISAAVKAAGPVRIIREAVIDCVYSLKRLLPNSDFFRKTR
jgi:hypothetical protein